MFLYLTDGLGRGPGCEDVGDQVAAVSVLGPASRTVKHRVVAADELLLHLAVRVVPEPGGRACPGVPEVLGQAVLDVVPVVGLAWGPVSCLQTSQDLRQHYSDKNFEFILSYGQ